MTELFLEHFEPATTERVPFLLLNLRVSTPETSCSSSQIPHIYISQKVPESYNFTIRSLRECKGDEEGKELHVRQFPRPSGSHELCHNFRS